MPIVKPFKGVVYNTDKIGDMKKVVAPPYDIISERMQDQLYRAHPQNIVRLILGKIDKSDDENDNRYTRAEKFFNSWLDKDIMAPDKSEAVYIYSQEYKYLGKPVIRTGFIALMEFGKNGKDEVLPHENTLSAPKKDRLELMRRLNANLSPIFILYDDARHNILKIIKGFSKKNRPFIDILVEGVRHKVWRLMDGAATSRIRDLMAKKDVFIADGHHRYEVARNYHTELLSGSLPDSVKSNSGYMMVYFVESGEEMLTVLPAHRVIKDLGGIEKFKLLERLRPFFSIRRTDDLSSMMSRLTAISSGHAFGIYAGAGQFYLLKLKDPKESDKAMMNKAFAWRRLDVSILHLFIFQRLLDLPDGDDDIEFFKNPEDAVKCVDKKDGRAAFFLNPTRVWQVRRIAKLGERMPRKATYFYPKPLSGLVVYKF